MLNRVMLIGRLGRDPELRYTTNGTPVCSLSIATDESYIDRDGNRVERTEWHRVSVFQRQAENCSQYLSKGSLVYVEGQLQTRKYQDQQGQERFVTEIRGQRGAESAREDPAVSAKRGRVNKGLPEEDRNGHQNIVRYRGMARGDHERYVYVFIRGRQNADSCVYSCTGTGGNPGSSADHAWHGGVYRPL